MNRTITLLTLLLISFESFCQTVTGNSDAKQIVWETPVPKPKYPAKLIISNIAFKETTQNNIIDANEPFSISFTITNAGKGGAYKLMPSIEASKQGITIEPISTIASLPSGESCNIVVTGKANQNLPDGEIEFTINVDEGNGFVARAERVNVQTLAFRPPKVVVAQTRFSTRNGGVPQVGEPITMQILIVNQGQAPASDVTVNVELPENVFLGDNPTVIIGNLGVNENRIIEFPFFTNSRYIKPQVDVNVTVKESFNKYGENKIFSVDLQQSMVKSQPMIISAVPTAINSNEQVSLFSDVDIDIPVNDVAHDNIFALVIGNQKYATANGEANVPFANADARVFAKYLENTLGVDKDNIVSVFDGTKVTMENAIKKVINLAKTYPNKDTKNAEIIVYYAGHGFYDNNHDGYIMPIDVRATEVEYAIKMVDLYNRLSGLEDVKVTMFLDACFSGGARAEQLLAARAVRIEPNKDVVHGKLVVFTATQSDQTAHAYNEKQHGMFTYFLLKKIQQTKGDLTYGELFDFLDKNVNHNSVKYNDTEQKPSVLVSVEVDENWSSWNFLK